MANLDHDMPANTAVAPLPAAEALFELVFATSRTFFRLRAVGSKIGAVTPWGGGLLGMLHGLKLGGPQTVPQIARARPVSRQRIQKLADEMAAQGLVEYVDNPAHKRSKLVHLTPKGETAYGELRAAMLALCAELAAGMDADQITSASTVL
ncbi:MAG: MarR family transcriptional regulator, partial [Alphaproteobacteria bacterium]|nr:MarR family transcriptional regulator [Alphaproteobacteria bacterium]